MFPPEGPDQRVAGTTPCSQPLSWQAVAAQAAFRLSPPARGSPLHLLNPHRREGTTSSSRPPSNWAQCPSSSSLQEQTSVGVPQLTHFTSVIKWTCRSQVGGKQ